jgi:hypothetical protein
LNLRLPPRLRLKCRMVHAIQFALFIAFMLASGAANAADESAAWNALRADGNVALIRHASAPGPAGDPADYRLDDCATQRNLSEQGRTEARTLGERFRTQRRILDLHHQLRFEKSGARLTARSTDPRASRDRWAAFATTKNVDDVVGLKHVTLHAYRLRAGLQNF